jgi:hypothetical protein
MSDPTPLPKITTNSQIGLLSAPEASGGKSQGSRLAMSASATSHMLASANAMTTETTSMVGSGPFTVMGAPYKSMKSLFRRFQHLALSQGRKNVARRK